MRTRSFTQATLVLAGGLLMNPLNAQPSWAGSCCQQTGSCYNAIDGSCPNGGKLISLADCGSNGNCIAYACCSPACNSPVGCNRVRDQVTLFPHIQADIFVTVQAVCGGQVVKSCTSKFPAPTQGSTDEQKIAKCHALVGAIRDNPDCNAFGFFVTESCDLDQAFEVADLACQGSGLQLGISCDPAIFSQTGAGQAICDYEADLISSGCPSPASVAAEVTLGGVASGHPIVPGPPHVDFFVSTCDPADEIEVTTSAGMTAAEVVAQAASRIRATHPEVNTMTTNGGRTLRLTRSTGLGPLGGGGGTSDTGLTVATVLGPTDAAPPRFPKPPRSPASVPFSCGLLGGSRF